MFRDTSAQDQARQAAPGALRTKRWIAGAGALAALVTAGVWLVSGWMSGARSVDADRLRIATVSRGDLVRDIAADGRVIAANSPTLYAIAAGTVTLKVVAGDQVANGQVLAVIDSPELRSRLAQEETTLAGLEAGARRAHLDAQIARLNARKSVEQARISHMTAERDLDRYQRAYSRGAVSQIDLARAEDEVKKAGIGLETAQEDYELQAAGAELDARNKQLLADRQRAVVIEARRQVDALTLRSPFQGQVGQVLVSQGTNVASNGPVMTVVDLGLFEVEIRVPEGFARELGIGMTATLGTGNGTDQGGAIAAVSPEVVNGEVTARIRFTGEQPAGLRQNQRLSVRVLMDARRDVLKVERGPFVEQGGGRYAWVVDGNQATRRAVRLGASSLAQIEVLEGLAEGERIVVSGAERFGDAEAARISF